jgi:hypothetical protein
MTTSGAKTSARAILAIIPFPGDSRTFKCNRLPHHLTVASLECEASAETCYVPMRLFR